VSQNTVSRHGGGVRARGLNQLAPVQSLQGDLDRTLGEAGSFRDQSQAGRDRLPPSPLSFAVKMEINQKCRRLLIVPDEVAHQNIEHVVIDRDCLAEARHLGGLATIPVIGQHFQLPKHLRDWTTAQAQSNLEMP
jgi:hypothetical protein